MFSLLALLTACSPEPSDAVGADEPTLADAEDEGADPFAPAAAAPTMLRVATTFDGEAYVELRAFRRDTDGLPAWAGLELAVAPAVDGTRTLVLPATPPRRDRHRDEPIVYAIALRSADADGAPGPYLGLGDAELVYYKPGTAPDGAVDGWNLVSAYGTDAAEVHPMSTTVSLGANLVAGPTLPLSGTLAALPAEPNTHLAVATPEEDGAYSAFDMPVLSGWALTLEVAPRAEAYAHGALAGAWMHLYAYVDDGDNAWNGETVVGRGCVDGSEVLVAWAPAAYDLQKALALRAAGLRSGWDLVTAKDGFYASVPLEKRSAVVVGEGCE